MQPAPAALTASAEQVRAAFLFQLAQYVDWPPGTFQADSDPIRFCILGQDATAPFLESTVQGKSIQGHAVAVAKISDAKSIASCHLIFIGFTREKQLRAVLASMPPVAVLLVGEADRFVELGGMVNLVLQGGRVSFEINLDVTRRCRIQFRSQLLRFARIVSDTHGGTP